LAHQVTLDQHPEFEDLILITADEMRIAPEFVRKDYWVVRILRAISGDETLKKQVIFKGGTSLSKGWKVIDRFSEDVDLLTTGPNFSAPPGKGARRALFESLIARIEKKTPLRRPELEGLSEDERNFLYFRGNWNCNVRFPLLGRINSKSDASEFILAEMGFRGGTHPTAAVPLNSFVGEVARARASENGTNLKDYEEDFSEFDFVLLHPTRTFVEKLLATHCAISEEIGNVRTRHYYDVFAMYRKHGEVAAVRDSSEFGTLLRDAIEIGNTHFKTNIDVDLTLADSPALNLTPEQITLLEAQYQGERRYYFRGQPPFSEIVDAITEIRDRLKKAR
jgi:hypothetical protein